MSPSEFWGLNMDQFWMLMRYVKNKNIKESGGITPEEEAEIRAFARGE